MTRLSRLGLALVAAFALAAPSASAWEPRAAEYEVLKETNVPIAMSDGVTLYADVLRPAKDGAPVPGRFPVVLTQTPYNKQAPQLNFQNDYLVQRGYVQVIADVRGTGSSEGMWDSFGAREQRDGYELVEWVGSPEREWSDGRVALYGSSYGAINQIFTAAQHPPGLKAIFPIIPASDTYRDITGSGGQVNTAFIPMWLGLVTTLGLLPPTYTPTDPVQAAEVLAQHSNGAVAFQGNTLVAGSSGGDTAYDGPFYRQRSPIEVIDKVDVPAFVIGGWWDLFQRGEPLLYQRLARNVPSRLLMGPWYHLDASGGKGLPKDGVPAPRDLVLRWFDRYVRGMRDTSLDDDIAPVTYIELGSDTYQRTSGWPFPDVGHRAFALQSGGKLAPGGAPSGEPDTLPWTPEAGVCTRSTTQWTAGIAGAGTPCETDNRINDGHALAYELPLTEDLRIGGPIALRLFVSTQAKDGQVTARLEDVSPGGQANQITAGWQVLSLRALDEKKTVRRDGFVVQPYHPFTEESKLAVPEGEPMEVWVEIFPTAMKFAKGHTLRLVLQSADIPHLTAPLPQAIDTLGGEMKVWHDAGHPSQLILPIRDAAKPRVKGVKRKRTWRNTHCRHRHRKGTRRHRHKRCHHHRWHVKRRR